MGNKQEIRDQIISAIEAGSGKGHGIKENYFYEYPNDMRRTVRGIEFWLPAYREHLDIDASLFGTWHRAHVVHKFRLNKNRTITDLNAEKVIRSDASTRTTFDVVVDFISDNKVLSNLRCRCAEALEELIMSSSFRRDILESIEWQEQYEAVDYVLRNKGDALAERVGEYFCVVPFGLR